jgi:hypothetical protein
MNSNFDFLEEVNDWKDLIERSKNSEKFAIPDDRVSFIYSRMALELIVGLIYQYEGFDGRNIDLFNKIQNKEFNSILTSQLKNNIKEIRICGNTAVHNGNLSRQNAQKIVENLFGFTKWFYENYGDLESELLQEFNTELFPSKNLLNLLNESELDKLEQKLKKENSIIIDGYKNEISELKTRNIKYEEIINQMKKDCILLQKKLLLQKDTINYEINEIGLTEQIGLIWGRLFVNLTINKNNYFAIKYFSPDQYGKATERFVISEGNFQDSPLFKMFIKQYIDLSEEDVLSKKHDHLELVIRYSKLRFGTPSILLPKLISNLNEELKTNNMNTEFNEITSKKNYFSAGAIEYGIHGPEIEEGKLYISIYHYLEFLNLNPRDYNTFKLGNYLTNISSNYKECKYENQTYTINKFDLELLKKEREAFEDYLK